MEAMKSEDDAGAVSGAEVGWGTGVEGVGEGELEEVPERFVCTITRDVMRVPVVAKDSQAYDEAAIREWVRLKGTSPMTRERMRDGEWFMNRSLKNEIEEWCKVHRPGWTAEGGQGAGEAQSHSQSPAGAGAGAASRGQGGRGEEDSEMSLAMSVAVLLVAGAGVHGLWLSAKFAWGLAAAYSWLAPSVAAVLFDPPLMKAAVLANAAWSAYPHAEGAVRFLRPVASLAVVLSAFALHFKAHTTSLGFGIAMMVPILGVTSALGLTWFAQSGVFWFGLRAHALRSVYLGAKKAWAALTRAHFSRRENSTETS